MEDICDLDSMYNAGCNSLAILDGKRRVVNWEQYIICLVVRVFADIIIVQKKPQIS